MRASRSAVVLMLAGAALLGLTQLARTAAPPSDAPRLVAPRPPSDAGLKPSPPLQVARGERNEYPDLTVAGDGTAWVTWVGFEDSSGHATHERIEVRAFPEGGEPSPPLTVEAGEGERFWPRIASRGAELFVAWCSREGATWQVRAAQLRRDPQGRPTATDPVPLSTPRVDAMRPAVTVDERGRAWVAWEEIQGDQIVVMLAPFDAPEQRVRISPDGELNLRPALLAQGGGVRVAWDRYHEGRYSIWLREWTPAGLGPPQPIAHDSAWHMSPTLAPGADGRTWIAWQSVRLKDGQRGVGSYLQVAAWEGGTLHEPSFGLPAPSPVVLGGQTLAGEDTLEFPSLAALPDGRLVLTARRGQGFSGWVATPGGWQGPWDLGQRGWGGWGRELRLAVGPQGRLMATGRLIHRVGLMKLSLPVTPPGSIPLTARQPAAPPPPPAPEDNVARHLFEGEVLEGAQSAPSAAAGSRLRPGPSDEEPPPQRKRFSALALGDLHVHSWISDGTGDADFLYTLHRDEMGMDFMVLTDHDITNGNVMSPAEFSWLTTMADFFYDPGRFVTLHGWEWTSPPVQSGGAGHKNVYLPGDDRTFFGYGSGVEDTTTLHAMLRSRKAIAVPHHIGWTGTDWERHDPDVQPVVELISLHGAFEYPRNGPIAPRANLPGMFVQDGLARGLTFGLVGGSDGHGVAWHYGVSRRENPWRTGMTGAWVESLTRDGLLGALRERRVYATSGQKVWIHVQADGHPMGSEYQTSRPPTLWIRAVGTAPLRSAAIIRDGQVLSLLPVQDREVDAVIRDDSLGQTRRTYYLRLIQADGEMAWSSPIFVRPPSPDAQAAASAPGEP